MSNPKCVHCQSNRVVKKGHFVTKTGKRKIQRYLCQCCSRQFSSQTFTFNYRLRLPMLDQMIFRLLTGGMSQSKIASMLEISRKAVAIRVKKFGRFCARYLSPRIGENSIKSFHFEPVNGISSKF